MCLRKTHSDVPAVSLSAMIPKVELNPYGSNNEAITQKASYIFTLFVHSMINQSTNQFILFVHGMIMD